MPESEIRQDGLPKAGARVPNHPGVIVSFDRYVSWDAEAKKNIYEPLSFPCDQFTKWQDNLRAIALALEALRKVDRYGVTRIGEQYKGWKQLPPASERPDPIVAAQFIALHAPFVTVAQLLDRERCKPVLDAAYKHCAKKLHPDAGGDHADFLKLQQAVAELRKKHGI
jgi:hypothetical protein